METEELRRYHLTRKVDVKGIWIFQNLVAGLTLALSQVYLFGLTSNSFFACYVDWRRLLHQIISQGLLLTKFVYISLRPTFVKFGWKRILCYSAFVTALSYFLVAVILDNAALLTWTKLHDNVIRRLDGSIVEMTTDLPKYESMRQDFEPFTKSTTQRFKGEDTVFRCERVQTFTAEVTFDPHHVKWFHNGHLLRVDYRHEIETRIKLLKSTTVDVFSGSGKLHQYLITSILSIYLLQESDFGTYSCYMSEKAFPIHANSERENYPNRNPSEEKPSKANNEQTYENTEDVKDDPIFSEELLRILRIQHFWDTQQWVSEHKLLKLKSEKKTIKAPIGGVLLVWQDYVHLDEEDSLFFVHEINGQEAEYRQVQCSVFVYLYWLLWRKDGHVALAPSSGIKSLVVPDWWRTSYGWSWICLGPLSYGDHRFIFHRRMYNPKIGKDEIVEIENPLTFEVLPRKPNYFHFADNESTTQIRTPSINCWGKQPVHSDEQCCFFRDGLLIRTKLTLFAENVMFVTMSVLALHMFTWFIRIFSTLVVRPVGRMILYKGLTESTATLGGLEESAQEKMKYDIYISYADQQSELASEFASRFRSRGLKVCYRDRHLLGGKSKIRGLSELIAGSSKFLVIVTPEYIQSGMQNSFELQLILGRLHNGTLGESDMAVLKFAPCNIPQVFMRQPYFDWTSGESNNRLVSVEQWVEAGNTAMRSCMYSSECGFLKSLDDIWHFPGWMLGNLLSVKLTYFVAFSFLFSVIFTEFERELSLDNMKQFY